MKSEKVKVNNGWKETSLGEVAVFNYGKGLPTENRKAGGVPVYGSSGITGFHSEALIDEPGYIIGRKGTVGSIHYSNKPFYPIDTVYYLTKQDIKCDFRFFYYLLQTLGLDKLNFDSAVPGLNRETAYSLRITIPATESEQKAIAAVLSSFDDKIELLRRQNKTLESIAQTIFKEWFVNFTVKGEKLKVNPKTGLPEGWRQKGLDEIADFLNGLAMQKYPPENEVDVLPVIKIRELKSGITGQTDKASKKIAPEYIVDNGDVLFSWSGSLDVVLWCYGKGALNQHLFKVTSKKYPKWFYYFWILEHLPFFRSIAQTKATTMGHIQRHHLSESLAAIPDSDFMTFADSKISPVFEHIISNNSQIQTLSKLRDTLLPKLMKGEIRVKDF
ncbi:MAG: restriction endonuclease subunit S [Planctomycetota bacterium]|nr:MAG: restriction endonuclease subunit S [Planctomycetota bacterium]